MKNYIIIGILAVLLLGSVWYNFNQSSENSYLKDSIDVYEKQAEEIKQVNFKTIDSLSILSKGLDYVIDIKQAESDSLKLVIKELIKTDKKNETALNNITDIDSIRSLFARYYPED